MKIADCWKDYSVLATGDGEKLEKWGSVVLLRPDPQVIWHTSKNLLVKELSAHYIRESTGGGRWEVLKPMPDKWTVDYSGVKFLIKPMGFKHTGLFPEQAVNWDFMCELVSKAKRKLKLLNLFAYTGGASVMLAKAGAEVTHVDASKGMVARAKQNAELNGIKNIRFIVDDCEKFVKREIKRGSFYDAVIMDPPSYGRGPGGEMWKLEDNLCDFACLVSRVLSKEPCFVLINSYTTGLSASAIGNILTLNFKGGKVQSYEVCLPTEEGIVLPCGCSGIMVFDERDE